MLESYFTGPTSSLDVMKMTETAHEKYMRSGFTGSYPDWVKLQREQTTESRMPLSDAEAKQIVQPTTWMGRWYREMRKKVSRRRAKNRQARESRRRNR